MKTITVVEYLAFSEIASRQKFYDHQLAYRTGYWNVFVYTETLEKFLIEWKIKYTISE